MKFLGSLEAATAPAVVDYASQIAAAQSRYDAATTAISSINHSIAMATPGWGSSRAEYDSVMAGLNAQLGDQLNKQAAASQDLNNLYAQQQLAQSSAASATSTSTAAPATTPQSPADAANALRQSAADYKKFVYLLQAPGYDYGVGSSKRDALYKGLGASMHGLYAMDRPSDGMGDFFSDVIAGVKGGVTAVETAGNAPALPQISTGVTVPSIIPSWLSTFVSGGVKAGEAAANAPAVNVGTGGVAPVKAVVRPVAASSPNYLLWGAALVVGAVAYKAVRA